MTSSPPLQINGKPIVIFSDYDGTITQEDAIVQTMKRFAPPEWKTIANAILETRTLSIHEGIQQLYGLLPSHLKQTMIDFNLTEIPLRQGFEHFMQFQQAHNIPFWVVSGGVDAFIAPKLAPWAGQFELFANALHESDDKTQQTHLKLQLPYAPKNCTPCGNCACCKVEILNRWHSSSYFRVVIGDSVTDIGMAKVACRVYALANSSLQADCMKLGIAYHPFETFDDIVADLKQLTGCL
jgi:2-hydroxy-3-keto-5-methylthiopentenyl-1-phosphate phosphatase